MQKLLTLLAVVSSVSSFAQGQQQGQAGSRKVTELTFEGDTIEGDISKPDVEFVRGRHRVPFSGLIQVRQDFRDKVMESVREL